MTNLSTTKATSQRHEKALDKLPHNNSKLISNNYNFDNVYQIKPMNLIFFQIFLEIHVQELKKIMHTENLSYPICENENSNMVVDGNTFRPKPVDTDAIVLTIKHLR